MTDLFKEELKRILEIKGKCDTITDDTDLSVMDSLGVVEVITLCEEHFGKTLTFEEVRKMKTYHQLWERLAVDNG